MLDGFEKWCNEKFERTTTICGKVHKGEITNSYILQRDVWNIVFGLYIATILVLSLYITSWYPNIKNTLVCQSLTPNDYTFIGHNATTCLYIDYDTKQEVDTEYRYNFNTNGYILLNKTT